jgi:HAMP domain-containing protein
MAILHCDRRPTGDRRSDEYSAFGQWACPGVAVKSLDFFITWQNLSVRSRLLAMVAWLVLSLIIVGGLANTALRAQSSAAASLASASLAQHFQQDADMLHTALRGQVYMALLGDAASSTDTRQVLLSLKEDSIAFRHDLESLGKLAADPELAGSVARVRPLAEAYITMAGEIAGLALTDRAEAQSKLESFDTAFQELRVATAVQADLIQDRIARAQERTTNLGDAAVTQITWVSIILSLLATLVVWLLSRSIRKSLRSVRDVATSMAQGNLKTRSALKTRDELGDLGGALDRMAANIGELIDRLRADADRDAFGAQLAEALEMADTEQETHLAVGRAMRLIAPDRTIELLLADDSLARLQRAAQHPDAGAPGCGVESPFSCIAVRRGSPVAFADSEALNACPRLRGRDCGSISAVCVPVSFMGRSLGVLHATGPVNQLPSKEQIAQLATLGVQAGARIGTVRAFARTQIQVATDSLTGPAQRQGIEASGAG